MTLPGDVKLIVKLKDVNLLVNDFEASSKFETNFFPRTQLHTF